MSQSSEQFAIRVRDLVVGFGRRVVIDHLSLDVRRGEILGLVGASGGGKSVAMHALEDAGYFCVDNLPAELLLDFLKLEQQRGERRVAIAVDVRSADSLPLLLPLLKELRASGVPVRIVSAS